MEILRCRWAHQYCLTFHTMVSTHTMDSDSKNSLNGNSWFLFLSSYARQKLWYFLKRQTFFILLMRHDEIISCMWCQTIAGVLENGVITVTWFPMIIKVDMYYSIPPATQILDSLNFFDIIFDCNSNQFVLPEDNDGIMSSSNDRHKLSRTLACNISEDINQLGKRDNCISHKNHQWHLALPLTLVGLLFSQKRQK